MKIPFLKHRSHPTLEELENLRSQRNQGIRRIMGVTGLILLGFVSFLGSMLVLQPMLELQELRHEKELKEYQLAKAQQEEQEARNRALWMNDPEYYENTARDRAGMAKPGETIIRRPSPADLQRMNKRKESGKKKPAKN